MNCTACCSTRSARSGSRRSTTRRQINTSAESDSTVESRPKPSSARLPAKIRRADCDRPLQKHVPGDGEVAETQRATKLTFPYWEHARSLPVRRGGRRRQPARMRPEGRAWTSGHRLPGSVAQTEGPPRRSSSFLGEEFRRSRFLPPCPGRWCLSVRWRKANSTAHVLPQRHHRSRRRPRLRGARHRSPRGPTSPLFRVLGPTSPICTARRRATERVRSSRPARST